MGAIYVAGPVVFDAVGLRSGSGAGLQRTFAVGTGLAAIALCSTLWGRHGRRPPGQRPDGR